MASSVTSDTIIEGFSSKVLRFTVAYRVNSRLLETIKSKLAASAKQAQLLSVAVQGQLIASKAPNGFRWAKVDDLGDGRIEAQLEKSYRPDTRSTLPAKARPLMRSTFTKAQPIRKCLLHPA